MELRPELEQILLQLKSNVPTTVLSDEPLLENNWNSVCTSIKLLTEALKKIKALPPDIPLPGFPYFRCPGMPVPWEKYPQTTEAQWKAIHALYPGDFMRLAGGNASKFKESGTSIYHDPGIKGDGGGQIDTFQDHQHKYTETYGRDSIWNVNGNDSCEDDDTTKEHQTYGTSGRVSPETRPSNVTIELYIYAG